MYSSVSDCMNLIVGVQLCV